MKALYRNIYLECSFLSVKVIKYEKINHRKCSESIIHDICETHMLSGYIDKFYNKQIIINYPIPILSKLRYEFLE